MCDTRLVEERRGSVLQHVEITQKYVPTRTRLHAYTQTHTQTHVHTQPAYGNTSLASLNNRPPSPRLAPSDGDGPGVGDWRNRQ
jgi:hypothetical protein